MLTAYVSNRRRDSSVFSVFALTQYSQLTPWSSREVSRTENVTHHLPDEKTKLVPKGIKLRKGKGSTQTQMFCLPV